MKLKTLLITIAVLLCSSVGYSQDSPPEGKHPSKTFAQLGTPANGMNYYCSDCQATSPCTSGGTGAAAARVAGAWNCSTGGSGTGNVVGPASATDNAISRFDSTTGKLLQNSSASVDDAGVLNATGGLFSGLTVSRAVVTDGSKNLASSATTATEIAYVSGVTSALQPQLDGKQPLDSDLTAFAAKTAPAGAVVGTSDSQALTFKTYNGLTVTNNGSNTLNIAAGKTATINNSVTLAAGADGVTLTAPATSTSVGGVLCSTFSVAGVGNSGTAETDLMSCVVPAGALNADGDVLEIQAFGAFANNANLKTVKIYANSTVLATPANAANNTGKWAVQVGTFGRASATTQVAYIRFGVTNGTNETANGNSITFPTETLSGTVTIKITGQSNTTSGDVLQHGMVVKLLN